MDPEVLEKLRKQDWNRLGRALVLHARRKAGVRAWQEGTDVVLALGCSAEDIAGEVIRKVFAGDRTWDPDRGDLLPTLKRMVESELDHLWKKPARQRERAEPDDVREQEAQERRAIDADPTSPTSDPQLELERAEKQAAAAERVAAVFDSVSDEPDLQVVLDAIMDGCDPKPRFLAEHLGLPIDAINNRLRRLRRKVAK